MRGPADHAGTQAEVDGGKQQKKISRGVDGLGICCKMCGSLDGFEVGYGTRR